jgi:hypothetical protein
MALALGVAVVSNDYDVQFKPTTGKIQAQGSDFGGNPQQKGTGLTVTFASPGSYPRYSILLDALALYSALEGSMRDDRAEAYAQLVQYLNTPGTKYAPTSQSFPRNIKRESTKMRSRACRQAQDCRIDFEIFTGWVH